LRNKTITILLIFSLTLNLGIISYLIYDKKFNNDYKKIIEREPPDYNKRFGNKFDRNNFRDKKSSSFHRDYRKRNIPDFTREEKTKIREFYRKTFRILKPKIENQRQLKRELLSNLESGNLKKVESLIKQIHANQSNIDIKFLNLATNFVKDFPEKKRKFVAMVIFRKIIH